MLFNSVEFLLFLPIIFILYWFVFQKSLMAQNILLLFSSYVFYGWWDWRFLSLIALSTTIDYFVGLKLNKTEDETKRKIWLGISLSTNLGMLGFFKYYNFFIESWIIAWNNLGFEMNLYTLKIILPVGISFYTFQTLSYTIDVYRRELKPASSFIDFAAFVSFFPQLVAGPIERASNLLPQFYRKRKFSYENGIDGVKLIIWGLFKKVVIADNCAFFVTKIFENPNLFSSSELFIGVLFFAFQIYGDFSGYSDIAIGLSKLFGFNLMVNFKFPYLSRDIAEFWRRWHISLSTWFRDYLYIPLGGSRGSKVNQLRNVFIIFLVSGFWHGANWTFLIWGFLHALFFLPLLMTNNNRTNLSVKEYKINDIFKIITTFLIVCLGWIFFRSDTVNLAFQYIKQLFSFQTFSIHYFIKTNAHFLIFVLSLFAIFICIWKEFSWIKQNRNSPYLNKFWCFIILLIIVFMGSFKNQMDFIYFQF